MTDWSRKKHNSFTSLYVNLDLRKEKKKTTKMKNWVYEKGCLNHRFQCFVYLNVSNNKPSNKEFFLISYEKNEVKKVRQCKPRFIYSVHQLFFLFVRLYINKRFQPFIQLFYNIQLGVMNDLTPCIYSDCVPFKIHKLHKEISIRQTK